MIKEILIPFESAKKHLTAYRNAILYLYEESVSAENQDMTRVIGEALAYCDDLIKGNERDFKKHKESILCLYFIVAVLGMKPKDITASVSLLEWLKIIPHSFSGSVKIIKPTVEKYSQPV